MKKGLRGIWEDLGRSIFEGERYERNMYGIKIAAILISAINLVTGSINMLNGYYNVAIASGCYFISGLLILFFAHVRKDRKGAVITALLATMILFTFEIVSVEHGFPIFWTLIIPFAFCYFASVRTGLLLSLYFLALYFALFFTPLKNVLPSQYPEIVAQRFPVLYLADVVLTAFIMIQYHRTTLHQMDNAKQLMEAKEAADIANAAKSEFLANMSHEIRTPINAVLGMNEMISRESAQFKGRSIIDPQSALKAFANIDEYTGDLRNAGNNLLAIINEILDFSKVEANRMELVNAVYQLSSMINDVSSMVFLKADDKGLKFTVDVDDGLPDLLYGDKTRMRQIVLNLLDNAVKYTREGGVTMTVRGEGLDDVKEGDVIDLVITVSDTGIGISEEDLSRMFTRFERVDMKKNSTIEGAGLGLAIAKRFTDLMGGTITAESVYGQGSVFTVTIPQTVVSAEKLGAFKVDFEKDLSEKGARPASFRAPEAHILIVDDTRMNLTVEAGLLKSTGIDIDTAQSGEEAISAADKTAYDLILMDQRMPEMDGTETMERIKALESGLNRDIPFICLTADAIIGAKERYMDEGFTDYLPKPADGSTLEQMLMKYLPEDKVIPAAEEEQDSGIYAADQDADDAYAVLRGAGIYPETGLRYCQGDKDLYRSLLRDYTQDAEIKRRDIAAYYEAKDWKNYSILAHALKSSSAMIGATGLSKAAEVMEKAAETGREKDIAAGHEAMLAAYEAAVKTILQTQGSDESSADAAASGYDAEILEFFPEGDDITGE